MRQYREYIIYTVKSISNSAVLYAGAYLLSAILFGLYPGRVMFLTGIFISLLSMVFHQAVNKKHRMPLALNLSILIGVLPSTILGILIIKSGYIEVVISLLYNLYLWKLAFDMERAGIQYDVYKQQFASWLRVLLVFMVVSAINGNTGIIEVIGRYSIIYVILGPVLLRNSRELNLVKAYRDRRAEAVNIAVNLAIVLLLVLVSSESFITYLKAAAGIAINLVDRILEYGVYVIAYPVGHLLAFVIRKLSPMMKPDAFKESQNNPAEIVSPDEWRQLIPHNIEVALKIFLLIIIAAVLIKMYEVYSRRKRKDDYTESRDFVFNANDIKDGFKKNLTSFASIFKRKGRGTPLTLRDKIRYVYYSFLELNIKQGIYKNSSQTHREIGQKTQSYLKDDTGSVNNLTDLYEKARYGHGELREEDLEKAAGDFKTVKDKYESHRRR